MKQTCQHLIFLHLPKNGGTTINSILNRLYHKKDIYSVVWIGTKGNLDEFESLPPEKKEPIKLLRGHFSYGLHSHFSNKTLYFSFLRHPEERILSFYTHVKRSTINRLHKKVTEEKMNFEEFILLHDIDGNNGQIRKLSGVDANENEMLEVALKNIDIHFPVIGLQEYFDESLIVLAHYFGWSTPYYVKKNVSEKKKSISEKEKQLIIENNKGDLTLYNTFKQRLEHQMNEVPYFKLKLLKLKIINYLISNNFVRKIAGKS